MEIYERWMASQHATSFINPLFRSRLEKVLESAPGHGRECFFCHGPSATVPEASLRARMTVKEGVSCDFCHTVYAARISSDFPRFLNRPGTKRGPNEPSKNPYHDTMYSPLTQESKLCAGCHEFKNRHNVGVLTTGTEWKESSFSGNSIHCQNCHLTRPYRKVRLLRKEMHFDKPPDHGMMGGHLMALLRDALKMEGSIVIRGEMASIELDILNDRAGHKLPTGIPTHRIALLARLFDERGVRLGEQELFFERVLGDESGTPLISPEEMFLHATQVLRDNRIASDKRRNLSVTFPLKENYDRMFATLSLFYELPSEIQLGEMERIEFSSLIIPYNVWQFPWRKLFFLLFIVIAAMLIYGTLKRAKRE